jgi:hypothetical protein
MRMPTDDDAIAAYEKMGGYQPGNPDTDQGCEMLDAMNIWRQDGVGGHQIDAFVAVKQAELEMAIHLFGCVVIGVQLPDSAERQFDADQPWDVVNGAKNLGGHCVLLTRYDPKYFYGVTWGKNQPITRDFLHVYVDEAYVPFSIGDWGKNSPVAVDISSLQSDLQALKA